MDDASRGFHWPSDVFPVYSQAARKDTENNVKELYLSGNYYTVLKMVYGTAE